MKPFLPLAILLFAGIFVHAQKAIDTTETLSIGGISQYITLKGADETKPLLLFLCGGPGSSVIAMADHFTGKLQKNFVVVQWDQRESGMTLRLNASKTALTVALMERDTYELIDTLLRQFHQKKLYLMAHSWGTVLGFYIAARYPENLYAYIAISPLIDQTRSERMALEMLKEKARQDGNKKELDELSTVQIPFGNWEQMYFARKWLFSYSGQPIADSDTTAVQGFVKGWAATWLPVWNEAIQQNHFKDLPAIRCPVYLCAGRKDYQTNFAITEEYYDKLLAPAKQLFWFENSGHLIPNTEADLLQDIIIQKILPATLNK
jgi:pimeloyl-ACP methyl ester carboxylesterase